MFFQIGNFSVYELHNRELIERLGYIIFLNSSSSLMVPMTTFPEPLHFIADPVMSDHATVKQRGVGKEEGLHRLCCQFSSFLGENYSNCLESHMSYLGNSDCGRWRKKTEFGNVV